MRSASAESPLLLSTVDAGRGARRLAIAVVAVSALVFFAAAPFARVRLGESWAFIPLYQSALVVSETVTALLLLGQFAAHRSRALLVLAAAYFFSAGMAVVHALSFPGLFAPGGLLGAGPQTTAWLYFLWHGGFPLLVIAYAILATREESDRVAARPWIAVATTLVLALAGVAALTALTTAGHDAMPVIMTGNEDASLKLAVAAGTWALLLTALALLWRRGARSVLELWLMVVMVISIFEVALAAVLNGARFDLGFYAGRVYGLAAGSFVLGVLLIENGALHLRLARRSAELADANRELESFSYSVSHDLRAPLRLVAGFADALEEDHAAQLDEDARRKITIIRDETQRMDRLIEALLGFSRLARQPVRAAPVDMAQLVERALQGLAPERAGRTDLEIVVGPLPVAHGDPVLLAQVWTNLLANAIKYSSRRRDARIEVSAEPGEQHVYSVRDNGAGFDPKYAQKLFGVFQRLHDASEFPGTGVGLALVQRIVSRHGGRIWADSRPGEGAVFHFTLPGNPRAEPT